MNLQTILDNMVTAKRAEQMKTSPQLTLGELILKLESAISYEDLSSTIARKDLPVVFDVEPYRPVNIDSWRGSYNELALKYVGNKSRAFTVTELLGLLKSVIGRTLTGYKGGEYLMGKTTPVWVANYGESCGFRQRDNYEDNYTAVVDVIEKKDKVVIKTASLEYL